MDRRHRPSAWYSHAGQHRFHRRYHHDHHGGRENGFRSRLRLTGNGRHAHSGHYPYPPCRCSPEHGARDLPWPHSGGAAFWPLPRHFSHHRSFCSATTEHHHQGVGTCTQLRTNEIKVNDLNGNPVNIGAIIVWQVADTAQATFAVEDMEEFIHSQSESALRHVATTHPYDGGTAKAPSLSGSTELVSQELADEVAARVAVAGLEIIEARISNLSYAPEIAQSMLQRQQAGAIVDARETIVEGAVSMVESALEQLESREIVDLDPERRAAMVSNLLVVLCSDNNAQPVLNTGSLYT